MWGVAWGVARKWGVAVCFFDVMVFGINISMLYCIGMLYSKVQLPPVQIDRDLFNEVELHAIRLGVSRAQAIRSLLRDGLGRQVPVISEPRDTEAKGRMVHLMVGLYRRQLDIVQEFRAGAELTRSSAIRSLIEIGFDSLRRYGIKHDLSVRAAGVPSTPGSQSEPAT